MLLFLKYLIPGFGGLLGGGLLDSLGKALAAIVENAAPIARQLLEGTIWFLKRMWEGLCDVADNIYTVMFVLVVCVGVFLYADKKADDSCYVQVKKLERQVESLRKNPVRTVPNNQVKWPWEDLFK